MGRWATHWKDEADLISEGSLFAAFAALARGEADSFPALRPHQREPWHAFCVQVAAMALIRAGEHALPGAEEDWRRLLIGLTPDWPEGEAWSLVVEDWSKPALLQPPVVRPTDTKDYKNRLTTPDALDMLVTSRNHDVKQGRMVRAWEEDWLFALVTLQTYEGFLGAGNYGISRMNGGFASRMSLGLRPLGGASAAFRRDVRRLVATAQRPNGRSGLPLLWLPPWDGTESLSFGALDPLYVDICRRVRLVYGSEGLAALAAGSKCARVAAAPLKGRTGDPWAPIKGDGSASVTPTAAGFGYRQITRLLDRGKTSRPLLAEAAEDDDREGLGIVATALVRGQGKTEGWHRRAIAVSRNIRTGWGKEAFLDRIGRVAKVRSDDAGKAKGALRRALFSLMQGGPDQVRLDDASSERKAEPWTGRFDVEVDRIFFDAPFWAEVDEESGAHRQPWRKRLRGIAREVFDEAAEAAPRTDVRRVRAHVRARSFLDAQLYNCVEEMDGE
jgi:CRISPR system Cascade subunit CasA